MEEVEGQVAVRMALSRRLTKDTPSMREIAIFRQLTIFSRNYFLVSEADWEKQKIDFSPNRPSVLWVALERRKKSRTPRCIWPRMQHP